MGKIIFVRRFISGFSEIIHPLQNMIKKDANFSWGNNEKESFKRIIESIYEAPSLLSPNFSKDFILYTFASDISYVVALTQCNHQNHEVPISFMSSNFKGAELNYHEVDKKEFVVLTQRKQQNHEVPISFMSSNFKGDELNYHEFDKKAFVIFRIVKTN